jgi:hypothetical protein
LDYKRLKKTIQENNFSLKEFIPRFTKMTVQGFNRAIENNTLKVKTLESISSALGLKMKVWWDESLPEDIMEDSQERYDLNKNKEVEWLKELKMKDQKIIDLLEENVRLREKLETIKVKERKAS